MTKIQEEVVGVAISERRVGAFNYSVTDREFLVVHLRPHHLPSDNVVYAIIGGTRQQLRLDYDNMERTVSITFSLTIIQINNENAAKS